MKRYMFFAFLVACLSWPLAAQAQYDDPEDGPPPAQVPPQTAQPPAEDDLDTNPDYAPEPTQAPVHPHVTVNGVNVFYFYDAAGQIRYYYFDSLGNRIFHPMTWRPWYIYNGIRTFFAPAPFVNVDGRIYHYYYHGNAIRYYYYSGGTRVFVAPTWRPYRLVAGQRVYYVPRVRYSYSNWARHAPRVRVQYNPRVYRTYYQRYYNNHYRRSDAYRRYQLQRQRQQYQRRQYQHQRQQYQHQRQQYQRQRQQYQHQRQQYQRQHQRQQYQRQHQQDRRQQQQDRRQQRQDRRQDRQERR